jgi:hypothetical protein
LQWPGSRTKSQLLTTTLSVSRAFHRIVLVHTPRNHQIATGDAGSNHAQKSETEAFTTHAQADNNEELVQPLDLDRKRQIGDSKRKMKSGHTNPYGRILDGSQRHGRKTKSLTHRISSNGLAGPGTSLVSGGGEKKNKMGFPRNRARPESCETPSARVAHESQNRSTGRRTGRTKNQILARE